MWEVEEKQVGQIIEKYSLFRTLLLGSGERLSFILKKSEEKGKKREMRKKDSALGIYNNLVRCFIWHLSHSGLS